MAFNPRRGHLDPEEILAGVTGGFTVHLLPRDAKLALCEDLLTEFGAKEVTLVGDELEHCCVLPWHDDKSPSARLNIEKLVYNCWSCGGAGGLLWFIGTCRGVSGGDVRRWLRDRSDGTEGTKALLDYIDQVLRGKDFGGDDYQIPVMSDTMLDPWLKLHPYMIEDRGISEETLMRYRIGWDSEANRIVIPHFWKGKLCGWQKRVLPVKYGGNPDEKPKYKNSPGFPRDETLYNYDSLVKPFVPHLVVVESPLSVLSKAHLDVPIVATFGAMVTDHQMALLRRASEITVFMDPDDAGYNSTERLLANLPKYSNVYVATNNSEHDPADMSDEEYLTCLDDRVSWVLWKRPEE